MVRTRLLQEPRTSRFAKVPNVVTGSKDIKVCKGSKEVRAPQGSSEARVPMAIINDGVGRWRHVLIDIGKDLDLYTSLGHHWTTGAMNYQVIFISYGSHPISDKPST